MEEKDNKKSTIFLIIAALLIGGTLVFKKFFTAKATSPLPVPSTGTTTLPNTTGSTGTTGSTANATQPAATEPTAPIWPSIPSVATSTSTTTNTAAPTPKLSQISYTPVPVFSNGGRASLANAVQTQFHAPPTQAMIVSYTDIYGSPATTFVPNNSSSFIELLQGSESVQYINVVTITYTVQSGTTALVNYTDLNNNPQQFYLVTPDVQAQSEQGLSKKSPISFQCLQGSNQIQNFSCITKTCTASVSGSSTTVKYKNWNGEDENLLILKGSVTINCLSGSDSYRNTPYDFTSQLPNIPPIPTLGVYNHASDYLQTVPSLAVACPVGQLVTQDCIAACEAYNDYLGDIISQRYIKSLTDQGMNVNSVSSQTKGGVGIQIQNNQTSSNAGADATGNLVPKIGQSDPFAS